MKEKPKEKSKESALEKQLVSEKVAKATKKLIGVSIQELNETLLDKLGKPLIHFTIDTSIPFKQAAP